MFNRITLLLAAAGMAFVFTGCATSPEAREGEHRMLDGKHIGGVNRAARKAGVEVIWINPPTVEADTVASADRDGESATP